jgi:hypothetical protein
MANEPPHVRHPIAIALVAAVLALSGDETCRDLEQHILVKVSPSI